MAAQTIQQEYMMMPPVTRAYTTACVITTFAVVSLTLSLNLVFTREMFNMFLFRSNWNSFPRSNSTSTRSSSGASTRSGV